MLSLVFLFQANSQYDKRFIVSTFLQIIPLVIYVRAWAKSWRTDWLMLALNGWRSKLSVSAVSAGAEAIIERS